MNRAKELIQECKIKLKIQSNYALAKVLKIHSGLISDYIHNKRTPNAYASIQIAKCLNMNPLAVIAEFEGIDAKNETEKAFWQDFLKECQQESPNDAYNKLVMHSLGLDKEKP